MNQKVITIHLGDFVFCKDDNGKRSVMFPTNLKLEGDSDVEYLDQVTVQAYSFLIGDTDLEDIRG